MSLSIRIDLADLLPHLLRNSDSPPPAPANARPAGLDAQDGAEELQDALRDGWRENDLGGTVFVIAYRASDGARSVRRVTLRTLSVSDSDAVMVICLCHERNAVRSFRLDRIVEVYDLDGVVHEPPAYFNDELGAQIPAYYFAPPVQRSDNRRGMSATLERGMFAAETPGHPQRRAARHGLRVLCALARADGLLHPAEVEVILDYIAHRADAASIDTTEADRVALARYVRRQRPDTAELATCLAGLMAEPPSLQRLFLRHAIALAEADGMQDEAEFEMLVQLRDALEIG